MRGSRALAAVAATGLSAALALGSVAPASASTGAQAAVADAPGTALSARSTTPFPGKSASQIKKISVAVGRKASSFHVKGFALDPASGNERVDFDLVVTAASAAGTLRTKVGLIEIRRIGNTVYLGSDAAWGSTTVRVAKYKPLTSLTIPATWMSQTASLPVSSRKPGKKVGGVATVILNQPGKKGGTITVAAAGRAYPLAVAWRDKSGAWTYSDWSKPVQPVKAPESATPLPG